MSVDDIPYQPPKHPDHESPASRLTLHHFVDSSQLGPWLPRMAPHNSDARQSQDTSEWPPAIILDLSYAAAALKAWGPKPFIEYVRGNSRDAYYGDGDGQDDDSMDGSGPSRVDAQMGNQTTVQPGSGRYNLRSGNNTSSISPKGRRIVDMMDIVTTLWMQSSRVNKIKREDAQASSLARNEGVKSWLQSQREVEGKQTE
jgi:hypothetical protein